MEGFLKEFMSSGRKLLDDTKQQKLKTPQAKKKAAEPLDADPHKNFIRRVTTEKPKRAEIVEDLKKFIAGAEAEL